jgi:hypothetical protein
MSAINQKVGIIVGTDHFSFPSAVANCVSAGISTVFHHLGTMEATGLPAQWGCLDAFRIKQISSFDRSIKLISFLQALPARYTDSECCFAGIPIWLDSDQNANQPGWLDAFRLDLGNTEALRAVFVPFYSPGVWRITGRRIQAVELHGFETQQLPKRTQSGGGTKYEQTLVISPGNCRRHNFCALDVLAGTVSWLECG